jgi:hypothetical protein
MGPAQIIPTKSSIRHNHGPDAETLAGFEVLAHQYMAVHPYMCGLHRCVVAVAAALVGYVDVRLLSGQTQGGGDHDRQLSLHRRTITLDDCSNSSATLRV